MSSGIVVCSECQREIHQDGPRSTWTHCEDKTAKCEAGVPEYPRNKEAIKGRWCGADDMSHWVKT